MKPKYIERKDFNASILNYFDKFLIETVECYHYEDGYGQRLTTPLEKCEFDKNKESYAEMLKEYFANSNDLAHNVARIVSSKQIKLTPIE